MSLKVLISGGGTGGHVYPGISLAYELKARNKENDIIFVGGSVFVLGEELKYQQDKLSKN